MMSSEPRQPGSGIDQGLLESWIVDAYASIESEFEAELQERRPPTVLERHARLLQILGAVQLGLLVATGSIFVLFIVLNLIFHMQP